MEGSWTVTDCTRPVGTCRVTREGLYYRFFCRCQKNRDEMMMLRLRLGEEEKILGLLIPQDGQLQLETRAAVKNFQTGRPEFDLVRRNPDWVPAVTGRPFPALSRLQDARVELRGGKTGIALAKDPSEHG